MWMAAKQRLRPIQVTHQPMCDGDLLRLLVPPGHGDVAVRHGGRHAQHLLRAGHDPLAGLGLLLQHLLAELLGQESADPSGVRGRLLLLLRLRRQLSRRRGLLDDRGADDGVSLELRPRVAELLHPDPHPGDADGRQRGERAHHSLGPLLAVELLHVAQVEGSDLVPGLHLRRDPRVGREHRPAALLERLALLPDHHGRDHLVRVEAIDGLLLPGLLDVEVDLVVGLLRGLLPLVLLLAPALLLLRLLAELVEGGDLVRALLRVEPVNPLFLQVDDLAARLSEGALPIAPDRHHARGSVLLAHHALDGPHGALELHLALLLHLDVGVGEPDPGGDHHDQRSHDPIHVRPLRWRREAN